MSRLRILTIDSYALRPPAVVRFCDRKTAYARSVHRHRDLRDGAESHAAREAVAGEGAHAPDGDRKRPVARRLVTSLRARAVRRSEAFHEPDPCVFVFTAVSEGAEIGHVAHAIDLDRHEAVLRLATDQRHRR